MSTYTLDQMDRLIGGNAPYYLKGGALAVVLGDELYKSEFASFAEYCTARHSFTEERARQLIRAYEVFTNLKQDKTGLNKYPASESEARSLVGLSPEDQRLVWNWCLLNPPPDGLTAVYIKSVADQARRTPPGQPIRFLTASDVPDTKWASDNELEIPLLSLDGQASGATLPFVVWGSRGRKAAMPGTYHFYTSDERFFALWDDPTPIVNSGCRAVIEPNFSIYDHTPRVVALYRIYLKRWLSRFWQEHGIKVFIDLNVAAAFYEDNLIGVPYGWKSYATRGYSGRIEALDQEYDLACQRAKTTDLNFLVYGGGRRVKDHCRVNGWLWFASEIDQAKQDRIAA